MDGALLLDEPWGGDLRSSRSSVARIGSAGHAGIDTEVVFGVLFGGVELQVEVWLGG
jgi:hypothetical protein